MSLERITDSGRIGVIVGVAVGFYAATSVAEGFARIFHYCQNARSNLRSRAADILHSVDYAARHPRNAIVGTCGYRDYRRVRSDAHFASDFGNTLPDADPLPSNTEVIAGVERLLRENERRYH